MPTTRAASRPSRRPIRKVANMESTSLGQAYLINIASGIGHREHDVRCTTARVGWGADFSGSGGPTHMMFIISLILFIVGLFLFGVGFMVPSLLGLVFTAGISAVCVAMAIPMFRSQWGKEKIH